MILFDRVSAVYPTGVQALREVSLHIEQGEFAFIIGPTGHGKSTLLKLIYREELPTRGRVLVQGEEVTALPESQVPFLRRRIGVVFQEFRLLAGRTAAENVAFALHAVGLGCREAIFRTQAALAAVGLGDAGGQFPSQLSAGERQRVGIARAIANSPPILLADEPTGNLDPATSRDLLELLAGINAQGTTVLVASHDSLLVDAARVRVIELQQGALVRDEREGLYRSELA